MNIPYINLGLQHKLIKAELLSAIGDVLESGQFILGDALAKFEKDFAALHGVKYALGVANGTDALFLSLSAIGLKPGDEVITAPNSFLASASSVIIAGGKPVFADVKDDFNLDPEKVEDLLKKDVERSRNAPKIKAIIAVHLTGRPAPMDELLTIAKKYNLHIIEDAAQAIAAEYKGKKVGGFGTTGCFSLHPLKNLAAAGDGGVITTNDDKLYQHFLIARNHGLKNRDECAFWSYNSRLDNLQAALLNVKMKYISQWTDRRRAIAKRYYEGLSQRDPFGKGLPMLLPTDKSYEKAVYHTFIIQTEKRDALKEHLAKKGIDTKVHYPIAIHQQEAAKGLGYKKRRFPGYRKTNSNYFKSSCLS